MDKKVVIGFIPAFNEKEKIADVIRIMKTMYPDNSDRSWVLRIIVIDDGSTDNTYQIAQEENIARIISHPINMGLGAATRTGMQTAYEMGADIAFKMDADFQHDPKDIENCIQPVIDDKADIVWGSRFSGQINYKMPVHRNWGNRFFTLLMRKLTYPNITDAQTGLMVFSRKYLSQFKILSNYNPPQQLLIDAHSKGMRYLEVPVVFHKRQTGKSFVSYKYPFKVLPAIIRILVYANPLKVFVPFGFFFVLFAGAIFVHDLVKYCVKDLDSFSQHPVTVLLLFIFGIQSIMFGLLADLIINRTR